MLGYLSGVLRVLNCVKPPCAYLDNENVVSGLAFAARPTFGDTLFIALLLKQQKNENHFDPIHLNCSESNSQTVQTMYVPSHSAADLLRPTACRARARSR